MTVRRGGIYWVTLDPTRGSEQRGLRPCVVLSADALNRHRRTAVVVPLSSSPRARPPLIVATPSAGRTESVALCDQLRTVDRTRFGEELGRIGSDDLVAVEDGVREVLGL